MTYEIRNEDDLFEIIKIFQAGKWNPSDKLHFANWPRYKITIRGKSLHGGIPVRILPTFTKLQDEINRGYARCIYGKMWQRRHLTNEEKKAAELVVHLEPGSVKAFVEAWKNLNNLITGLSAKEIIPPSTVALIIIMALNIDSGDKYYSGKQQTGHSRTFVDFQAHVKLTYGHTLIAGQQRDTEARETTLLKGLDDEEDLFVDDAFVANGRTAQKILEMRRRPIDDPDHIVGIFVIEQVKFEKTPNRFRIWVRRINSDPELDFPISVPSVVLIGSQINQLRDADALHDAWKKKTPFHMQIMVTRHGDRTTRELLEAYRTEQEKHSE